MSFYKRELQLLVNYKIFTKKDLNQNNKFILHLKLFIMTCSKCVKYISLKKDYYSYLQTTKYLQKWV